jgi:hypothetical protein
MKDQRVHAGWLAASLAASLAAPCVASAQTVHPAPRVRIDVDFGLPVGLEPLGTGVRGSLAAAVGARVVTRSGFGGAVGFTGAGDLSSNGTVVETAHPEGWLLDMSATYRLRPLGDDRRGLGVDLAVGASLANLGWDPGHSAYDRTCPIVAWDCDAVVTTPYVSPEPTYTTGARAGPFVSVGVDGRLRGFVFGVSAAWRALVYYGDRPPIATEPTALHVLTVNLHAGFGFSL